LRMVATSYGLLLPHDQSVTCVRYKLAFHCARGDDIHGESHLVLSACADGEAGSDAGALKEPRGCLMKSIPHLIIYMG
jgi:hypothetical protein